MASGEGASHDSDVELAAGTTLEHLSARRVSPLVTFPHAGPHQRAAARPPSRWRHALADLVRLPTRALDTEAAQRTFDFGDTRSYPLEILTRE